MILIFGCTFKSPGEFKKILVPGTHPWRSDTSHPRYSRDFLKCIQGWESQLYLESKGPDSNPVHFYGKPIKASFLCGQQWPLWRSSMVCWQLMEGTSPAADVTQLWYLSEISQNVIVYKLQLLMNFCPGQMLEWCRCELKRGNGVVSFESLVGSKHPSNWLESSEHLCPIAHPSQWAA